jgi:hypothetical protein
MANPVKFPKAVGMLPVKSITLQIELLETRELNEIGWIPVILDHIKEFDSAHLSVVNLQRPEKCDDVTDAY